MYFKKYMLSVLLVSGLCGVELSAQEGVQKDFAQLLCTYIFTLQKGYCDRMRIAATDKEGTEAGYVEFVKKSDGTGYVAYLKIHRAFRDKGLGSLLLQAAVNELYKQGCHQIELQAYPLDSEGAAFARDLARLKVFYGRYGFNPISPSSNFLRAFAPFSLQVPVPTVQLA